MNNDSVAEQGRIQREHEVNMSLTTMSEMMFKGSMRKSEMRKEMIDKLNEVVDGLTECVKSANTIEELNAGLETKEIERYFDEHTKGVCRKYEDEFDHSKEEYEIQKAKRIWMIIFECVKGTVRDNWSMLKEREYRPRYENEARELTLLRRSNHEAMETGTEHGTDIQKECRACRDKVEDIITRSLRTKVLQENLSEKDRQITYVTRREDATRFQLRLMLTLTRKTTDLKTEEAVEDHLRGQKHLIYREVARIIRGTFNETDTNQLYLEICKLAVCQWKLQREVLLELMTGGDHSTSQEVEHSTSRDGSTLAGNQEPDTSMSCDGSHNHAHQKDEEVLPERTPDCESSSLLINYTIDRLFLDRPQGVSNHDDQICGVTTWNRMKRDSKIRSLLNKTEVTVRIIFNTRLNGDLRWMWYKLQGSVIMLNKLQGNLQAGSTSLKGNTLEELSFIRSESSINIQGREVGQDRESVMISRSINEQMLDVMSDDEETLPPGALTRKEHFRLVLDAMSDNEQESRNGRSSTSEPSQEDDQRERRMMLQDLKTLTEEQAVTTNLIKVTAASMKCWFTVMEDSMTLLMEQHEKTSRLIKSITNITNQVIINDVKETVKMTKGNDNIKQAIGKCKACKVDFLGPTCARDTSKTYYKKCSACYQPKPRRK